MVDYSGRDFHSCQLRRSRVLLNVPGYSFEKMFPLNGRLSSFGCWSGHKIKIEFESIQNNEIFADCVAPLQYKVNRKQKRRKRNRYKSTIMYEWNAIITDVTRTSRKRENY